MKRTENAHFPVAARTHEGMKGKNNEDSYAVSAYTLNENGNKPVLLAVLSDGIGGHQAGEVASAIAVDMISKRVAASDGTQIPLVLKEAIEQASNEINAHAQSDSGRKGMGATVAVICIIENRLFTASVGDSRIYLVRDNRIRQLTIDHTWIQEALELGLIKPEQVEGHPNAHVIRRYLGGANPPVVDFRMKVNGDENDSSAEANQGTPLRPGDYLLSCSDGLTDLVKDHEIQQILQENSLDKATQLLTDLANQRGGHDNITIVAMQVPEDYAMPKAASPLAGHSLAIGCASLILLAFLGAGLFVGWRWMHGKNLLPFAKPSPTPTATEFIQEIIIPPTETPLPTETPTNSPTPTATSTQTAVPTSTFTITVTGTLTEEVVPLDAAGDGDTSDGSTSDSPDTQDSELPGGETEEEAPHATSTPRTPPPGFNPSVPTVQLPPS